MVMRQKQVLTEAFPFVGGLDLKTPALQLPPGCCIDAVNYEPDINGGYRRMYGYERFDGRQQPHTSIYWNMAVTLTGAVTVGNVVTGATSGATAVVLQVNGTTELIVTALIGTFKATESIDVSATPVGTVSSVVQVGAQTPILHATYLNEAAGYYRNFIQPVPGSNPVRGVWYYNGKLYAFRDNAGATAANMFVASSGSSATVAISIASPGVISWVGHGLAPGAAVSFSTTGALPTGLTAGTTYYVANAGFGTNSFSVATTVGGAPIATSGTQSGSQTATAAQGWQQISFGREILFAQYQSSVTITIASPGVVTWTGHKLANGQAVIFEPASGAVLPTGITAGNMYYVVAAAANTFEVAASPGGTAINTTGSSSGTITCTVTYTQISAGQTVTGGTSGATAVVQRALLRTGTWSTAPVGSLVFDSVTGAFQTGEALIVGGDAQVATTAADTAITLQPGGRCVFENFTFTGSISQFYMYFCDGVNFLQEFDGVRLVPIRTGIRGDNPSFMKTWQNMLVAAVGTSVEVSGLGQPYSWTALTGAAELAIGDNCTGMLERPANQSGGGALAIYTGSATTNTWNTWVLYGSSAANFQMVLTGPGAGSAPHTAQNIGDGYSLDSKGVVKMEQTLNYGNFEMSVVTRAIQPIIDAHRGMATASCIVRATDQYRVFFNDGTGIIIYIKGKQTPTMMGDILTTDAADIMPFDYSQGAGIYFNTVDSIVDDTGVERIFAGGSNGYVYELERGSSFDGAPIASRILMAFNSSKTPRNRKHYHRSVLQVVVQNTAQVNIGYDLNYAKNNTQQGQRSAETLNPTGTGLWDIGNWDSGTWDTPFLTDYVIDTPGNGLNFALLIFGSNAVDYPHTIQSMISHYSVGRLSR